MGRILFFVGLGIILYALIRTALSARKPTKKKRSKIPFVVHMCECSVCGTHFPEDEAVLGAGVKYCSEACRAKARGKHAS